MGCRRRTGQVRLSPVARLRRTRGCAPVSNLSARDGLRACFGGGVGGGGFWGGGGGVAAARQDLPAEGDGAGAPDQVREPLVWRCPRPTCDFGYNNRFVSACVECNEPRPEISDLRTAARHQGAEAQVVIRDDPVPAPPRATESEAVVISDSEEEAAAEGKSASVRRDDKQGGETEVFGGWISDDAPEGADEENESQDLFEPVPKTKRVRTEEHGVKLESDSCGGPERKRQRIEGDIKEEVEDADTALSSSRPALSPPNTRTKTAPSPANAPAVAEGSNTRASDRGSSFRAPYQQPTTDTFPKILSSPVARIELPRPRLAPPGLLSFEGQLADRGMYVGHLFRDKAQQKGCARAAANELRSLVQVLYVDACVHACMRACVCACIHTHTHTYAYTYTCMYVCIYVCMYVCVCT